MTMHDNLHVLLRHAWVFSVDPRRDLFLRTCFVRTELCGFAAEEWDCPQQSVYHVHQNVHHVLQWPATILKTKQHTSEKGYCSDFEFDFLVLNRSSVPAPKAH